MDGIQRLGIAVLMSLGLLFSAAARGAPRSIDASVAINEPSPAQDEIARLMKAGQYAAAEAQARILLAQVERTRGASSLATADAIDLLVEALCRDGRGRLPEALDLARRALAIRERELGDQDPALVSSLRNLGTVLAQSGDAATARTVYERAIAIQERAFGPRDPRLSLCLVSLANLFMNSGDNLAARLLYERALAIQEQAPERDEALISRILHNLALVQYHLGDYATAESLFTRTLELKERIFGPEHVDVAWTLNALAIVLEEAGDYARARTLYEHALKIWERVLGPDHIQVSWVLNNLGMLQRKAGDYAEAAACFERSLAIKQKSLGPEDPGVTMTRTNLAHVYRLAGDLDAAQSQLEAALAITLETAAPDRPAVAETLNALATVLAEKGELDRARSLYEQALAMYGKTVGPRHPDYAVGLRGLARLLLADGDLVAARSLLEEGLAIQRASLDPDHPAIADSLETLGVILARQGDAAEALRASLQAESIGRDHLKLTARTLSEREALRYASTRPSGLGTALSIAADGVLTASRRDVWDALIRSRALILEEVASRRHLASLTGDPDLARLAADLVAASRRLANLSMRGPGSDPPRIHLDRLDKARREKERAERALAEASATFKRDRQRDHLGFAEVSTGLPPGSALVAYVRYQRQPENVPAYLAFVLRGGAGSPALVSLGAAAAIDGIVSRWVDEMGRGFELADRAPGEAEQAALSAGMALRARIWDPLLPALGKASRVFVVPDGALHLVNLDALPAGQSTYLLETGPLIHYVTSERDIVRPATREGRGDGLLAIGGVAFDTAPPHESPGGAPGHRAGGAGTSGPTTAFRGETSACVDFQSVRFAALPASGNEADAIAAQWRGAEGKNSRVMELTGPLASEAAFKKEAGGRRVLHIATHGFFLGGRCLSAQGATRGIGGLAPAPEQRQTPTRIESPLLLTGLALAGANRRGEAGPDDEDGILTAEEIAAMDLSGVEWAVLSACDTGAGQVAAGEGVLGLRRALTVAGVQTVIMSLWSVDDEAALAWMRSLYEERLVNRRATAEAVRAASLSVLRERRAATGKARPSDWAAFVAAGDWR